MRILRAARQTAVIVLAAVVLCLILAYMSGVFHEKVAPEKLEPPRRTAGDQPTDIVHKIKNYGKRCNATHRTLTFIVVRCLR